METAALRTKSPILPAALLTTVVLWATAFPGIRAALDGYGPGELALFRYLIGSVALGLYLVASRPRLPNPVHWRPLIVIGIAGFTVYNLALNFGEQTVTAGSASFVVSTVPIFTALLAAALLKEPLHRRLLVGSGIAVTGIGVIAVGEGGGLHPDPGIVLVLGAAIAQAFYFVLQRKWLLRYRPVELTTYAMWVGTALMLPFLPALVGQIATAPIEATGAVVYLGVMPGAVGYVTWAHVLSRMPASEAAPYLYLVPVLSTLVAWVWLQEAMGPLALTGGAVALLGVIVARQRAESQGRRRQIAAFGGCRRSSPHRDAAGNLPQDCPQSQLQRGDD